MLLQIKIFISEATWNKIKHNKINKRYLELNRVSIGSDNDLSPIRRQAIILTNAGSLSIRPLGTSFVEILSKIRMF